MQKEIHIEYLNTADLVPYDKNPRKNDNAVGPVAESIKQFGFKSPIVIDKNNVVVCGHTRLKAAKKLRMRLVPCVRADDLTDEQIRAYRLADNKTAEIAEWDIPLLDEELLAIMDIDMSELGFEMPDPEPEEDGFDLDSALAKIDTPVTKLGTVYKLGNHCLMCGSAISTEDMQVLTGGGTNGHDVH